MHDRRIKVACNVAIIGVTMFIGFQFVWLQKFYQSELKIFKMRINEAFLWALFDASAPMIGDSGNYPDFFAYNMETKILTIVKDGVQHDFLSKNSDIPVQFARANYDIQKVKRFNLCKLDSCFREELKNKKLYTSVEFTKINRETGEVLATLPVMDNDVKRPLTDTLALGYLSKDVVIAKYNYPKEIFLYKMSSVLITDFVLISILVVCIYFQFRTILLLRRDAVRREYLVRTMVHELKRPLNYVKAVLDVSGLTGMPPPSGEIMTDAGKRMEEMIVTVNRILESTATPGSQAVKREFFNLSESIADLTDRYNFVLKPAERVRFAGRKTVEVYADKVSLLNAISNLIDNGLKYSGEAGVVKVYCFRRQGTIWVSVEDRGCGIAYKERKAIFRKYYRGKQHRSESAVPGFGLGLSYAGMVVRAHDGKIRVKSELGRGSRFVIVLPAKYKQRE